MQVEGHEATSVAGHNDAPVVLRQTATARPGRFRQRWLAVLLLLVVTPGTADVFFDAAGLVRLADCCEDDDCTNGTRQCCNETCASGCCARSSVTPPSPPALFDTPPPSRLRFDASGAGAAASAHREPPFRPPDA